MLKLFLSFVLGGSALHCWTEQLCNEYRREKTILLSCRQRWERAESEVSGKSLWKRRVRTWTPGRARVFCSATAHPWMLRIDLRLFWFASPCYLVVYESPLEWLLNRRHWFSCCFCTISLCWLLHFLCVSSKWEPLDWSWSRASPAALWTICISFDSVQV